MKQLFALIFCLLASISYSQQKRINISSEKIGPVNCTYSISIDIDKADTLHYVYIGFQNQKYTSISDIKSIIFMYSNELVQFTDDLKKMLPEMDVKNNNIEYKRSNYKLTKYDFSKYLFLSVEDGNGYTSFSKGQVERLIKWIEGLEFKGNS